MSTSTPPSPSERLKPQRRGDLIVRADQDADGPVYLVKDPLSLKFFRLRPQEHRMLELCTGQHTLGEIHRALTAEFAATAISLTELLEFMISLVRSRLLLPLEGLSTKLQSPPVATARSWWLSVLSNVFYCKVSLFDPDRLVTRLHAYTRWIYSTPALAAAGALVLTALVVFAARCRIYLSNDEQIGFQSFLSFNNLLWLWLAAAVVKVLHEFGHAITCKHFGGECHEMGVLLMCFTPCLYCDATDSWLIANRWHRMAVSLAGIYVEVVLASLATLLWAVTGPGVLHYVCFWVMCIGSVQTILINANPLMKFDGYFIFSDWLQIANLRARAQQWVDYFWLKGLLGDQAAPARPAGLGAGFALYAVLAKVYTLMLSFGILYFLTQVLKPYGMESQGWGLASAVLLMTVAQPLVKVVQRVSRTGPTQRGPVLKRLTMVGGAVLLLATCLIHLPLPRYVSAPLTLEPEGAMTLSVAVPGRLLKVHAAPGVQVTAGQLLFELENPDLQLERQRLKHEQLTLIAQRDAYAATLDPERLAQLTAQLAETERVLESVETRVTQLQVKSPITGVVLHAEGLPQREPTRRALDPLHAWSGTVFDTATPGAWLEAGTSLCGLAPSAVREGVALIRQQEVELVREQQAATVKFDGQPFHNRSATVTQISLDDAQQARRQLTQPYGGDVRVASSGAQAGQLLERYYPVRLQLPDHTPPGSLAQFPIGARGRVWISVPWASLWDRGWRAWGEVFDL